MHNEIPLPYYLQQHELSKSQLTKFSQMPHAAKSLQSMSMSPYLMSGSSIITNKPLIVFTGADPEYSVEDYLNAVTANLVLIIRPAPVNTLLHQNWIHRRTALSQTTPDGAGPKTVFSFTYRNKIKLEKVHTQNLKKKCLIQKEANIIKKFYAMKFVDYQMEQ